MRTRFAALFLAAVTVLSLSGCSKYTIGEKPSEPEVRSSTEVTAETSVSTETSTQEESQVSEEEPDYADMPLWDPTEFEYDELRGQLYFFYDDPEIGERIGARIVRKLEDGSLLIQAGWSEFGEETGYKEHYTDKYFVPAVG